MKAFLLIIVWQLLALSVTIRAHDWPQFLGPARNGVYAGDELAGSWPKEGPAIVWQKKVGQGFSGPVVAAGKMILFHRLDNQEAIECFDAATGQSLWKFESPAAYRDDFGFDEGPRATPAIADGRVYTLGADGSVHCLELATGKKVWDARMKEQFAAGKGFFGMACSPLVEGNAVLLNIGGADGAGIVAFDKNTGRLLWKATNDEASYSSPMAATIHGGRHAIFLTRNGLVSVDPPTGRTHFQFPWRARLHASVNAATPLVIDDSIFLSASYDTGAILLQVRAGKLQKIWSSDDALSNHYATSVHRDGFLYGFHGRQEEGPSLRCVELKTGKVRWDEDRFPAGTVTLAGDSLLVLLEDGRLLRVPASPDGFKIAAQAQVLPFGARAYPALANGFLYARSKDRLVSLDLRK